MLDFSYQAGIPTHNSNQATIVGPFQRAKGVPAFIASSKSSCLWVKLKWNKENVSTDIAHAAKGHKTQWTFLNLTFSSSSDQSPPCPPDHQDLPYCLREPSLGHRHSCNSDDDWRTEELSRNLPTLSSWSCLSCQRFFPRMTSTLSSLQQLRLRLSPELEAGQRVRNPANTTIKFIFPTNIFSCFIFNWPDWRRQRIMEME